VSARVRRVAEGPLAARVVEVIADLGPSAANRYLYGSGCIVQGRTVLTAAHVVADAVTVSVRDPDKREYSATVDPRFVGDARGPGPDLALVQIDDPRFELVVPPIGLARVDRDSPTGEPVERCHAVGYPWFAESPAPSAVRETVDATGVVPVLSRLAGGLLSVQVSVSPRPLPPHQIVLGESEWSGMSGAPVVAAGHLLGVVTEHAPREGQSAITAVPLTALEFDPAHPGRGPGVGDPAAWWSRLGVSGPGELRWLPARRQRPTPPYWDKVREFGWTLHQRMPQLLGRQRELADIAAFATGTAGYLWLVGGAFTGKTALMYETVTVGLPAEVDVVCYFLSQRASDADSSKFLSAVVPQLAYLCEEVPPTIDRDREFPRLWHKAADRAAADGRHLLLVVDGLDEDVHPARSPSVTSLLPTIAGGHAHVLVASRPHPDLPLDVEAGHPLKLKSTPLVELKPFEGAQELADLPQREIHDLTHEADADLAVGILGLLTAAKGAVSVKDLASLLPPDLAARTWQVRRFVEERAARSLEPVGPTAPLRYQFAHYSLLEYAQADEDLSDPEYRDRIHRWADQWRAAGWRTTHERPPRYLLDAYPATLSSDPQRLAALVSDANWVSAAIQVSGVDSVLAHLGTARSADPADASVSAVLAAVRGQAQNLRLPQSVNEPGYVLRQLCLQATELGDDRLASDFRTRLQSLTGPTLVPMWTTRRASRALSVEFEGHDHGTAALAVLPDGRVVSGGMDGKVRVWNPAAAGPAPVELGHHDGGVLALAVLPDGRVVSGGMDGKVRVRSPAQPDAGPMELGHHYDMVTALAVTPDGRVVSGGRDGRVLVQDPTAPEARPVELDGHGSAVHAVAVLADSRVVFGGRDRRVLVWGPAAGTGPAELGRHDRTVRAMAVLPGERVVSSGDDGRLLIWDLAAPQAEPTELGRHHGGVHAVAVTPDARVVCGGRDRRVRMWDPAAPGAAPVELGRHDGMVTAVAVTRDGLVASGGTEGCLRVWDPATPGARPAPFGRHDDRVTAVAVAPDGNVFSGGRDGRVLVWDPGTPEAEPTEIGRHSSTVRAVAVLPDGHVVSSGQDRLILAWDPDAPGAKPVEVGRHGGAALAALGGGRVVSGGHDGRVLVWDLDAPHTGPAEMGSHCGAVTALAVLPDGRVISSATDGPLLLWDPAAREAGPAEVGGRDDHGANSVAVLPGGKLATGGRDGRVLVRSLAVRDTGLAEIGRHGGWVNAVAALPDGRVVSSGADGRVHLWDPLGKAAPETVACSVQVLAAGVSRSGGYLLAFAHKGGGISIWRITVAARGA
jgi:WD40 repeat protein